MKIYDLAIIGSGPGGYVAGLYASRHKLKICVIEKGPAGGTCLNLGCIPTKSLLNTASILSVLRNAGAHGVDVQGYSLNFPKAMARKDEVVARLRTGVQTLLRANKVDLIQGSARLGAPGKIEILDQDTISAENIIIASGSKPCEIPGVGVDGKDIIFSDEVLSLPSLPKSIAIIGGGVIGCEFATLLSTFGVKTTIIELADRLIPTQSIEASRTLGLIMKKKGVEVLLSSQVTSVRREASGVKTVLGSGVEVVSEKVLLAAGRRSYTEGLGLEEAGVATERGTIVVDSHLRTSAKQIFAIGDCIGGPLLAHKASYDGILACDNILGNPRTIDYSSVPNCIWTEPEIASVGLTEDEAKSKHHDIKIAKFPYLASGKAYLKGKVEGYVKIIGDGQGDILGVEIFGEAACELIGEATLAKASGLKIQEWARVVHGHPTISEIFQEAAGIFCGAGIHTI